MAKITTVTNPLTGQPAQVDQLDHTAQQIDDAIARALPGGAIDIALQNKLGGIESTEYPGCYYRMVSGVVEWFNPPMALGEEYRTTERYQGKPVYVQSINFSGALPASGNGQGIINTMPIATTNIIDINVTIKNRTTHEVQRLPSVSTAGAVTAICNPLKYQDHTGYCFRITVFADMSGWDYQALIVKYTKSTD